MFQTFRNNLSTNIQNTGFLKLSHGHEMFWEISGNINGTPVVFIHGGPGARSMSIHQEFFDSNYWKAIFYDQRGCGKSKPSIDIENNNTELLIEDLEQLRKHLNIDKWLLFGGSWGSTLALCYAIKYPEKCLGLLLRGIFLGTKSEIEWFICEMGRFFPEAYRNFLSAFGFSIENNPSAEEILVKAYSRLFDEDPKVHQPAAEAWASYEISCATIEYEHRRMTGHSALSISRIEAHYFKNNCFLKPDYIMKNLEKLKDLPITIIQGRHDVICPPFSAFELKENLNSCKLIIVDDSGHSAFEKGIKKALLEGMVHFKEILN